MKLAIIGVTGNVGKHILDESLRRGHTVTGIARDTSKLSPRDGLTLVSGDADQPEALASLLKGHDVVISSVPFRSSVPARLIEAVRRSGVKRYLVVGGAGALEVAPGKLLLDTPHFAELPEWIRTEALAGKVFFDYASRRYRSGLDHAQSLRTLRRRRPNRHLPSGQRHPSHCCRRQELDQL